MMVTFPEMNSLTIDCNLDYRFWQPQQIPTLIFFKMKKPLLSLMFYCVCVDDCVLAVSIEYVEIACLVN